MLSANGSILQMDSVMKGRPNSSTKHGDQAPTKHVVTSHDPPQGMTEPVPLLRLDVNYYLTTLVRYSAQV